MNTKGEYNSWRAMIARCENPEHPSFANYGGRGIRVCSRWRWSFASFLLDVGLRPSARHSLDRIDPNGGYHPANVRWATPEVQARNKRVVDLTGQRFGRLTVLHRASRQPDGRARWACQCVCGRESVVDGKSLRSGNTRSCGCLSRDKASERMASRNRT
jgi:hypothetical protein